VIIGGGSHGAGIEGTISPTPPSPITSQDKYLKTSVGFYCNFLLDIMEVKKVLPYFCI